MLKKNQLIPLEITGMTADGNGVGRHEGMAVFLPLSAVGDRVTAKIVKVCKSYAYGIIHEILEPSPARIQPDCPVFSKCGACSFRHLEYQEELRVKETVVRDAFQRIGKLEFPLEPILGCPQQDGYRNKAMYPVAPGDSSAKDAAAHNKGLAPSAPSVCGFYAKMSHRVIPYTACRLQPGIFQEIVECIMDYLNRENIPAYREEDGTGIVRHLYLRQGAYSGEIMVCLVVARWFSGKMKKASEGLCAELVRRFPKIRTVLLNLNPHRTNVILGEKNRVLYGDGLISDTMCGIQVSLSPHAFYQVNTLQAERLYGLAAEYAGLTGQEAVLDLYCGTGTIGLFLARCAREVVGVETIPEAVQNAQENAERNGISNIRFLCADAGKAAQDLASQGFHPQVALVDPPRKGCGQEALDALLHMKPDRIVMISCNPATAARDCAYLAEHGYVPVKGRAVDLFPRTSHVETIVLLQRKTL